MDQCHQCHYGPMSLTQHSAEAVARLIETSSPQLLALMFGRQAIAQLTDLVERSHNRFSHRYICVATIDQQIVGMAILIPATDLHITTDYQTQLNCRQRLWLKLVHFVILQHVLQHDYPVGTFYLGNLAVAAAYRNRGIGRQLLQQCLAAAAANPIFISVDLDNPRAQQLYESLGFRVVATKAIQLGRIAIGSRILLHSIAETAIAVKPHTDS